MTLLHRNVAGLTMEVRAVLGLNDLKAVRDALDGRRSCTIILRQACHAGLAALPAPQLLVPLIVQVRAPDPLLWRAVRSR